MKNKFRVIEFEKSYSGKSYRIEKYEGWLFGWHHYYDSSPIVGGGIKRVYESYEKNKAISDCEHLNKYDNQKVDKKVIYP